MILNFSIANIDYQMDSNQAFSIAILLKFNDQQPNHFGAKYATRKSLAVSGFIGDTKRGGSCNVDSISMVPHCNGTHTESIAHIVHQKITIGNNLSSSLATCRLISVTPVYAAEINDSYLPELQSGDKVIDLNCLTSQISTELLNELDALVIRTIPNGENKLSDIYDQNNQPPFFTHEAISWLAQSNITHLLVDMPSIDKMYDDGYLNNHHIYWNIEPNSRLINDDSRLDRTITEMIYVDDSIADGYYCLNLQIPAFELDAAPSRPILYPLHEVKL
ncbi:MAG: cyclase family protein [Alcanivoracaceae bacterium]|nr:cyclase family protein [Alcanivoracaceae bacterium]